MKTLSFVFLAFIASLFTVFGQPYRPTAYTTNTAAATDAHVRGIVVSNSLAANYATSAASAAVAVTSSNLIPPIANVMFTNAGNLSLETNTSTSAFSSYDYVTGNKHNNGSDTSDGVITAGGGFVGNIQPPNVTNAAGFWAAAPVGGGSGGNANTNAAQTWTAAQQFTNAGNRFIGDGTGLTNVPISPVFPNVIISNNVATGWSYWSNETTHAYGAFNVTNGNTIISGSEWAAGGFIGGASTATNALNVATVNPMQFGAKGDTIFNPGGGYTPGFVSGSDDSLALQAMFNFANNTNQLVNIDLLGKTYQVNTNLYATKIGMVIENGTIVTTNQTLNPVIWCEGDNESLQHMSLYGPGITNYTGISVGVIAGRYPSGGYIQNFQIDSCRIQNFSTNGWLNHAVGGFIKNSIIICPGSVALYGNFDQFVIEGNVIGEADEVHYGIDNGPGNAAGVKNSSIGVVAHSGISLTMRHNNINTVHKVVQDEGMQILYLQDINTENMYGQPGDNCYTFANSLNVDLNGITCVPQFGGNVTASNQFNFASFLQCNNDGVFIHNVAVGEGATNNIEMDGGSNGIRGPAVIDGIYGGPSVNGLTGITEPVNHPGGMSTAWMHTYGNGGAGGAAIIGLDIDRTKPEIFPYGGDWYLFSPYGHYHFLNGDGSTGMEYQYGNLTVTSLIGTLSASSLNNSAANPASLTNSANSFTGTFTGDGGALNGVKVADTNITGTITVTNRSVGIGTTVPGSLLSLGGTDTNPSTLSIGTAPVNYNGVIGVNAIDIHANQNNPLSLSGAHAVRDESTYNVPSGTGGYGGFDANAQMLGTIAYNHFYAFQSRQDYEGSGLLDTMSSFVSIPIVNGPVNVLNGISINDPIGTGTITQQNGIYIGPLTRGVSHYAIFQDDSISTSWFRGPIRFDNNVGYGTGTAAPLYPIQINATDPTIALSGNGATTNQEYGDIRFNNRGYVLANTPSAKIAVKSGSANPAYSKLVFSTWGTASLTERMAIDEAGNVGIGTNAPAARFHVTGGPALFGGGIKTQEGDIFYPHTVGGNLVWTTSP